MKHREDYNTFRETKGKLIKKKMKEKLRKQTFHHDMEKNIEPSTDLGKKSAEDIIKTITVGNENLGNTIHKAPEVFDDISQRKKNLTDLINSNAIDCRIVKTLADFLNSRIKSQNN